MSSIGFTGTELLKNIKKRTYTSKAELVRECGYQEVDYYGVEKINYSKFYDEFLKAFGVSIKKKYSSDDKFPNKKQNKQSSDYLLNRHLSELNELVGLSSVKEEVKDIINLNQISKEREKLGLINEPISMHLVFQGPPGTGKTTIARLIGKIYKSIGILSKGHFLEVDRSKLIGRYIGQTTHITRKVLEQAHGGVLFIDEAYSLLQDGDKYKCPFGQECINTIIKYMEDNRNQIIVIVAGYPKEMENFLSTNPGLKSRFNTFINFPSFRSGELLEIFSSRVNESGYFISDEAKQFLKVKLERMTLFNKKYNGNARSIRNLFELIKKKQASRLMKKEFRTKEDLVNLTIEDFDLTDNELDSI